MSSAHESIPVLIVGGGPVGLAVAIELGLRGIACTLVERREGPGTVPRMSGLSTRGMELNRRWGIARRVETAGWPTSLPNDFVYCTSLRGYELARVRIPAYRERPHPFSPEKPCGCAQSYYDPLLLERARSLPSITIRHCTQLDTFDDRGDVVTARVTDLKAGRTEEISARFLVACDGADSGVAAALDIAQEGTGVLSQSVNVFFRSPELAKIHDKGWARFFRFTDAGGSWGELIGIDGKELWRLSTYAHEGAGPGGGVDARRLIVRLANGDVPHEILSVMEWKRREVVAAAYRRGRVFLAGDAAHQHSPTGGLGLHTGLIDAVDLGWKLAATLEGWGGPKLLDSYEAERKPIALKSVRVSTGEFHALSSLPSAPAIADDSEAGAAARRAFAEHFRGKPPRAHFDERLRIGYCYEGSPIVVPDGTPPDADDSEFVPKARPGARAPHAWIEEGRSTLDLFGRSFVLLRLGADPPPVDQLVDGAERRGVPLEVVDLPDREIAERYERRLVLVRPDGHVAWRDDVPPPSALALIDRVRGSA